MVLYCLVYCLVYSIFVVFCILYCMVFIEWYGINFMVHCLLYMYVVQRYVLTLYQIVPLQIQG